MAQQQLGKWHDLTAQDVTLYQQFYALCTRDGKKQFSSDTFREYGLDRNLSDKQHDIGCLFARWKWHRLIVEVDRVKSRISSNHGRKVSVFKFRIEET